MIKKIVSIVLPILILGLAIVGARLESTEILYGFLGIVSIAFILGALGKLRFYPLLIFCISLGLLYQTTLYSNYIMGTDNHGEYYFANLFLSNGGWDYTIPWAYNTALSTTILAPTITLILGIPLEWVFKAVLPLFLAGVPILLYFLFIRWLSKEEAFLSCAFLVSVVTWQLELTGIGKQMVGELCFVGTLYLIISKKEGVWKYLGVVGLGVLTTVTHYSMGLVLIMLLGFSIPCTLLVKYLLKKATSLRLITIAFLSITILSGVYFYTTAQGNILETLKVNAGFQIQSFSAGRTLESIKPQLPKVEPTPIPSTNIISNYLKGYDTLIRGALGLDWELTDTWGKVYRVLSWVTEILIICGCIWIVKNRRRFPGNYLALGGASICILGGMVLLPWFSPILNATRFYNIALLMLCPTFILGGLWLFRRPWPILIILIPYFLVSSGLPFEVLKYTNTEFLNIPYSHALSAKRISTTGIYTDNDAKARDWISYTIKGDLYADIWGQVFLVEKIGGRAYPLPLDFKATPPSLVPIPEDSYIYFQERNEERQELTFWSGVGVRKTIPYKNLNMKELLRGRRILREWGNTKVYGPAQN